MGRDKYVTLKETYLRGSNILKRWYSSKVTCLLQSDYNAWLFLKLRRTIVDTVYKTEINSFVNRVAELGHPS